MSRSIPARAGETITAQGAHSAEEVYPRPGGGNCVLQFGDRRLQGLSPHGRGKRRGRGQATGNLGLSPHGRGKRQSDYYALKPDRSIPARAGETVSGWGPTPAPRVYPRTGGGNILHSPGAAFFDGLSPHGRGKRIGLVAEGIVVGSIPARAGETPGRRQRLGRGGSIPARAGETSFGMEKAGMVEVYPRTGGGNR